MVFGQDPIVRRQVGGLEVTPNPVTGRPEAVPTRRVASRTTLDGKLGPASWHAV